MVVHNGAATIELALRSLLSQTFRDWECILINDGSTDETRSILERFSDTRLRIFTLSKRRGRGYARKKALHHVSGRYVATLDADDFYYPVYLESQLELLESFPEAEAAISRMILFDQALSPLGRPWGYLRAGLHRLPVEPHHLRIPFVACVFRTSSLHSVTFDENLPRSEDMDFYLRLLAGKTISVGQHPHYAYRWSFRWEDVREGLHQSEKIYEEFRADFPWRAMLLVGYTRFKRRLYALLVRAGLWDRFGRLRYCSPSRDEQDEFSRIASRLRREGRHLDGGVSPV